jgi:uncharacterized protein (DUF2141 family)
MIRHGFAVVVTALTAVAAVVATEPPIEKTRLTVKVTDLRNHDGQLIFGVFQSAKGFPSTQKSALNWQVTGIDKDEMSFTAELPPGEYAASVLHDENKNNDMDTNLIGIPTEGYGVTNNPKPRFRGAKFKEALFTLPKEGAEMTISLQYF